MSRAPEIVVLCLTDVEGSAQLWQMHGHKMGAVLDQLDLLMDTIATSHGGVREKERGEGDSHFCVFKLASDATRAAAQLQYEITTMAWPHDIRPAVRIGLHTGEVLRRGIDYSGIAVNRAARLRAVAHGGQVVASRVLVELIAGELGDGLHWTNLGVHRIRDFPGWTDVYQLCAPFLRRDFPTLVTLDTGLPPITTIVFLDADGLLKRVAKLSADDENALFAMFSELFAGCFARARGQFLQFIGDGCLALFADPHAALEFAREAQLGAHALEFELRGVVHLGRVEFAFGAPYGRAIRIAIMAISGATPGKITLTPTAAAVLEPGGDVVLSETHH